jgi:hypothetical protein
MCQLQVLCLALHPRPPITAHAPDEDGAAEQIEEQHEQATEDRGRHGGAPNLVTDADVQQLIALDEI